MFTFWFAAGAASIDAVPAAIAHVVPTALDPDQPVWKVLVVDDVATNRHLLDELLSAIGFATRTAASGEEAIDVHGEWHPDLVLMDLRMPGIGGLEAVRRLREGGSKAAIIAVTASGLADAEDTARDAGVDAFVRKPYREGELLAAIGERLGARYTYGTAAEESRPPADRASATRSTLSQRIGLLPLELIDQLRAAAIEGRVKRLESLADEAGHYSASVSAEIRTLARDFQYDAIVSALGTTHDRA